MLRERGNEPVATTTKSDLHQLGHLSKNIEQGACGLEKKVDVLHLRSERTVSSVEE